VPQFISWIRDAVEQVVDPHKRPRQAQVARLLEKTLRNEGPSFSMAKFNERVDHTLRDIEAAKRILFRKLIDRAWADGKVTSAEKKALKSYSQQLELPSDEAVSVYRDATKIRFAALFARAMEDGNLDQRETAALEEVTQSVGLGLRDYIKLFFRNEGEYFLSGLFNACTNGGELSDDTWTRFTNTAAQLGFADGELSQIIQPQAKQFVEHVLADQDADNRLSQSEISALTSLVSRLAFPAHFTEYVQRQLSALRIIRDAAEGRLVTLERPLDVAIRAGEIVYLHSDATWVQTKVRRSGPLKVYHHGTLTITDNRLLFSSESMSFVARFARIVRHGGKTGIIRLQLSGQPESTFLVDEEKPIAYSILESAIALSNQTRISKSSKDRSRHIPREVRQRAWQRCGGRCVECGADEYLEYDHIIPVARGGSNSDQNVQVLCRKCNLKKSDFI
jgi:HNH endonuclease